MNWFADIWYNLYKSEEKNQLILVLANLVGTLSVFWIIKKFLLRNAKKIAKSTEGKLDDLIVGFLDAFNWPFFIVFALKISLSFIPITTEDNQLFAFSLLLFFQKILGGLAIFFFTYDITKPLRELSLFLFKEWFVSKNPKNGEVDSTLSGLFDICLNVLVWGLAFLLILQNFGVEISTVIGALGVSGVVVAFALQNVLTDIFASLSIYLDRPFSVGDFIVTGTEMGTVQKIGVKSTRIKSLQGEEIVLNNKTLIESRVHNYKKMENRRVVFNFSLDAQTPTDDVKIIPGAIKDIIQQIEICRFDRANFNSFGDMALRFEVVYFINSPDYNTYMEIQQKINLEIKSICEEKNIRLAVPLMYQDLQKIIGN